MTDAALLFEYYSSGYVKRFHNRPMVPAQTTGQHSFGMLTLLLKLHPNPSKRLIEAIIRHDLPELISGDFPLEAKKSFPVLKEVDDGVKDIWEKRHGQEPLELEADEKIWLAYLDQLEVIYYLSMCPQNPETQNIMNNCSALVGDFYKQLQAFGYFTDPQETVH